MNRSLAARVVGVIAVCVVSSFASGAGTPGVYSIDAEGVLIQTDPATGSGFYFFDIVPIPYNAKEIAYQRDQFCVLTTDNSIVSVSDTLIGLPPIPLTNFPAGTDTLTALEFVNDALFAAAGASGNPAQAPNLVIVNPATGTMFDTGSVGGLNAVTGLAWDGAVLYLVTGGGLDAHLYRLNLTLGSYAPVHVGQLLLAGAGVHTAGLAFGEDGKLYTINQTNGANSGSLLRVDKYTGTCVELGPMTGSPTGQYRGLTRHPDPGLFAIENAGNVFEIDPRDASGGGTGGINGAPPSFYKSFTYGQGNFYAEGGNTNIVTFDVDTHNQIWNVPIAYPVGYNATTALVSLGGTLYGAASVIGSQSPSRFISINPQTGAVNDIGNMVVGPITGFAWSGSLMYATNGGGAGANLYTVDLLTGSLNGGIPVLLNGFSVQLTGLRFGNDGLLYGLQRVNGNTNARLLVINPTTGVAELRGEIISGGSPTNDLAVVPRFPSAGDDCYDPIDVGNGTTFYDLGGATPSTINGSCVGAFAYPDRYYRYAVNQNGLLTATVCDGGAIIGTQIYLNTSCPVDEADELACDVALSGNPGCAPGYETTFPVSAGDTVLIRLNRNPGEANAGELRIDFQTLGDDCFSPYPIADGVTPYAMAGATYSLIGASCYVGGGPDQFYLYTATHTGPTLFTVCDDLATNNVVAAEIWSGAACPPSSPVFCGRGMTTNGVCPGASGLSATVQTVAGQQYLLRVATQSDAQTGVISISPVVQTCVADVTTTNTNPGDPGYGSPDGTVDGADLSYFVENWLGANGAVADVTTTNTNPGDPGYGSPDGTVDGADLSYFVENWLAGCP